MRKCQLQDKTNPTHNNCMTRKQVGTRYLSLISNGVGTVGLDVLPNSDLGNFRILSISGLANHDMLSGKVLLLQLTLKVPKFTHLKNAYLFWFEKLPNAPFEYCLTLHT